MINDCDPMVVIFCITLFLVGILTGIVLSMLVWCRRDEKPVRPTPIPPLWSYQKTEKVFKPKSPKKSATRYRIADIPTGPGPRFVTGECKSKASLQPFRTDVIPPRPNPPSVHRQKGVF